MKKLDYRVPADDRYAEPPDWPITRAQLNGAAILITLAFTVISFGIVVQGAGDEPYMRFRRYDAIVQVGLGTTLMVLWAGWSLLVLVLVRLRKLARGWLLLLFWAAICLFYLADSPLGYLEDVSNHIVPPSARGR